MKEIIISGGGLAGLALGILLRRESVPVTIHEASFYPRHKVCGEFLSGAGVGILQRLLPNRSSRERTARSICFYINDKNYGPYQLPLPAVCLSRHTLDHLLATEFEKLQGTLICRSRVQIPTNVPGWVRATGRRINATTPKQWVGLKAHHQSARLSADLDLVFSAHAYVGLCRVEQERVNVCGLFKQPEHGVAFAAAAEWQQQLATSCPAANLTFDSFIPESFCSVSALEFSPARLATRGSFSVGDSSNVIAPFTGNGMSLALESAALATPFLVQYSAGKINWEESITHFARAYDTKLFPRISRANALQGFIFNPAVQQRWAGLLVRSGLWKALFSLTR